MGFFSFMGHVFGINFKSSLPGPRIQRFSLMFSSKSLLILCSVFKSVIHFELVFV